MEASNGAHYWTKALSGLGHEVRLISPQFVTPYVKSNNPARNGVTMENPAYAYPLDGSGKRSVCLS
jgi:transposase